MALNTQSVHLREANRLLLVFAGVFLGAYSLALTLSPAARIRSWNVEYRWEHWLGYAVWIILVVLADRQIRQHLQEVDPYLFPVTALLTGWGLLTIWRLFPDYGLRQTIWIIIVSVVFLLGLRVPFHLSFLRKYKYVLLTAGLILTAFTLILGTNPAGPGGPRLWLGCCGVYFQPSEPLKLLLIIFLSAYLAGRRPWFSLSSIKLIRADQTEGNGQSDQGPSTLSLLAPVIFMTGLTLLLLFAQRDLGTAAIFLFLFVVITYLATQRKIILVVGTFLLAIAAISSYLLLDVVRLRIDAWLNPWIDPSNRSYQIVQSLIAIANGGIAGRGPGMGNPTLVPVSHSDFIFSAIVEEGGLVGGLGIIGLLMLLAASGIRITLRAPDNFRRYLAAGLTAYLIGQSLLIIGGNIRLLPLTGVTLPFVSYGGSSLLTAYVSLLLLALISQSGSTSHRVISNPGLYIRFGGFLLGSLTLAALVIGWWSYQRGPNLVERIDNARRGITDRYVMRGDINDRENKPIVVTGGTTGTFERDYLYPDLGSLIGYSHPAYGQSGLEASLDRYLRGLEGHSELLVWWHHLLYGQPPPGLDIRLNIDIELQQMAMQLLEGSKGALVLINAESGEIFSLASRPSFEPDEIEESWESLVNDENTPLLNRVVQGRYEPSTIFGPFLITAAADGGIDLVEYDQALGDSAGDDCSITGNDLNFPTLDADRCIDFLSKLAEDLGNEKFTDLLENLGLFEHIDIVPGQEVAYVPTAIQSPGDVILGNTEFLVSPLQAVRAAATLSSRGNTPNPSIVSAVNLAGDEWTVFPSDDESQQVFTSANADEVAKLFADDSLPIWHVVSGDNNVTWYMAGTLPDWSGVPLSLVVVLEDDQPERAFKIGREMMEAALQVE